jgi:hypothetical protein
LFSLNDKSIDKILCRKLIGIHNIHVTVLNDKKFKEFSFSNKNLDSYLGIDAILNDTIERVVVLSFKKNYIDKNEYRKKLFYKKLIYSGNPRIRHESDNGNLENVEYDKLMRVIFG